MWEEFLVELWNNHRGKVIGLLIGLLFSCLVLAVGFWRALFVILCMVLGLLIGKRIDEKGNWREIYQRLFREP